MNANTIKINIYTICYNEEIVLPHMIKWYKDRFPNCHITVYDNYSSDKTEQIALDAGCTVIKYDSNNEIRDDLYLEIKNNCWKNSDTDWNLICDADEWIQITAEDLMKEEQLGSTIISFEGWNMITMSDDPDIIDFDLHWASRSPQYDKYYLFNKKYIKEIHYSAGCHGANPKGLVKLSEKTYPMYHFKALGLNYMINRYKEFSTRLSLTNLQQGWAVHYLDSADTIKRNWKFYQEHPDNKKVL